MEVYMQSKIKDGEVKYYSNSITMDSESVAIGTDNRCTACILHTPWDFVVELVKYTRRIKGLGGARSSLFKKWTLKWK